MVMIGHNAIAYPKFRKISHISEISFIDNASMIWFDASEDVDYELAKHCVCNDVKYSVLVENIKDFVIYANLKPAYLMIEESPEMYQKIAETYLLDSKVLYIIEDEDEISLLARMGIDGVIFREVLE